jgi:hypothetical protein
MSDEQAKVDEIIRLLEDVPAKSAELASFGHEIIQSAQMSSDVAAPRLEIFKKMPTSGLVLVQLDNELASLRAWHNNAEQVLRERTPVNSFVAAASGVINTTISCVSAITFTPPLTPDQQAVTVLRTRIVDAVDRSPLADRARVSMERLGLDRRGGKDRPALDLLDEAAGAMAHPVIPDGGRPTSVLIPLRGAIEAAISELLRRRRSPKSERTSSWSDKVASIGRHCGHSYLDPTYFPNLCSTITPLHGRLSGAKDDDLSREEVSELFARGVAFLNALMEGIDERLLNP